LIFLASTLTMRLWSEERRTGTLEHVYTQPVPLWHFVVGKFVGCLSLLATALVVTLPLPLTVSIIGELDWGPVWAGYLATFLLGAAYLSIGLFVSARSDNQIVSLISSVALCGLFYILGAGIITDFFGNQAGEWLRLFATGARFESITRGVIDLRDLYYYLSIIAVFLTLNTYVLERERWATLGATPHHRVWRTMTALLIANAVAGNLWLGQLNSLRVDATEGDQYSISDVTENYLQQLQEPLLLRGYFSAKTHPLLAPLVPQMRDLMREYEIAGHGKVRVEFVDPARNPELEEEANQKYGIQPVPFQVADRYQASIVSSYFNILVQYGDEYQVLGFRELIEVKQRSEADLDVQLRNPEHDLTRAIKKVLQSYQSGGNLFDTVKGDLKFTAYVSGDAALPEQLVDYKKAVEKVVAKFEQQAQGRLKVDYLDPDADGGKVAEQIDKDYGFRPMATGLFSDEHFYFYLTLAKGEQIVQIPLDDFTEAGFERNLAAGIKRFASGFTKTVALVKPESDPAMASFGMAGASFDKLEQFLGADLNVQDEDLSDGSVSGEADVLLLVSPKGLDEKQVFAVDQFLMQGGTVIAATSPYAASLSRRNLSLEPQDSGLKDWLAHYGLSIDDKLVLDPQNAAFPVPVARNVGGFTIQEMRMLDYPYFIDIRASGMDRKHPITADLPQVTMAWASPLVIDPAKQDGRKVTELLHSSQRSWLSSSLDVMPHFESGGAPAYTPEGEQKAQLLGAVVAGRFESYFAGKESPLLKQQSDAENAEDETGEGKAKEAANVVSGVIERSPESARIVLFGSNDFVQDQVVYMSGAAAGSEYLNTLQLMANTVEWSLEETGLSGIRARGHFNRTLPPMEHGEQLFWEYANYVLAALALGFIALLRRGRNNAARQAYLQLLND
ncbi:MAG: Gldg family protein, partial [Gammaproteobacteria bacterium]